MTNEELATRIQKGEKDFMLELWEQVRRFIAKRARSFSMCHDGNCKIDQEDLIQSGYLALSEAVKTFDASAGSSFINYLNFHLRRQFRKDIGINSSRRDALLTASSADAPLPKQEDATLLDTMRDPLAEAEFEDVIDRVGNEQIVNALISFIQKLQPQERDVLIQIYIQKRSRKEVAELQGLSDERIRQIHDKGLTHLRTIPLVKKLYREHFLDKRTSFYRQKGYRAFNSSFSSVVEDAVIKRERIIDGLERSRSMLEELHKIIHSRPSIMRGIG